MAGKIFMNYRRGDDAGFTQALYLRLEHEFSENDLFMDVEGHIRPGDDFVEVLNRQVSQCDVLLAIIGPRWADLLSQRRDDKDDFVVIEIKAALDQGKRVIPVLVGGASVPRADTLPDGIKLLARRNAVGLRAERFKADCQGLVTALKELLATAERERTPFTESERRAAEVARQEEEFQAATRAKAAEDSAREKAAQSLSPQEARKVVELANWQFIQGSSKVADFRDHLARFPDGVTEPLAFTKLEELAYAELGERPDIWKLKAFLEEFPRSLHSTKLRAQIRALDEDAVLEEKRRSEVEKEKAAWSIICTSLDRAAIEEFLRTWPAGLFSNAAKSRLTQLGYPELGVDPHTAKLREAEEKLKSMSNKHSRLWQFKSR